MGIAISASGLTKEYRLGRQDTHGNVRDAIVEALARGRHRLRGGAVTAHRLASTVRVLDDVSFDIAEGEIVGVIGQNGSGKSTLLKILSRITEPTAGRASVRGRIGSLLEVGTGFHPELTGRENVRVNGAILGMKRTEIAARFDEIVAFAGVERFIDTPVKFYSSGMQMRLAFAVAAHLESEILLVDEVLAVGDLAFQKKCLGKMSDVARDGRTILFVSHDLSAVQVLCGRAIRLSKGRVAGIGTAAEQTMAYVAESRMTAGSMLDGVRPLSGGLRLVHFGFAPNPVTSGQPATFELAIEATEHAHLSELAVLVHDVFGKRVGVVDFRQLQASYELGPGERLALRARIAALPLVEGEYRIGLSLQSHVTHDIVYDLMTLDIGVRSDVSFVTYQAAMRGIVAFEYDVEMAEDVAVRDLVASAPAF